MEGNVTMEIGVFIGILLFLIGIAIGSPLYLVFLGSSFTMLILSQSSLSFIAGTFYHSLNNYILMAIGFFILAGSLLSAAGLSDKLVDFSYLIIGRIKGGLIATAILAATFLGALTGSAVPVVAALAPLLVNRLEKMGYEKKYTTAVLISSSFLGYLIPPSLPVLLYCLIAQQSVAAVLLSTVIPGLMLSTGYIILNYFICDKYMRPTNTAEVKVHNFTNREKIKIVWDALPALGCPIIVLGGIYGGICTPNEAGALAVVYTLLIGLFVYRKLNIKNILSSTNDAIISLGMICVLIAIGTVFARVLIREDVAQAVAVLIIGLFQSKALILIMMNLFLLMLGMFIDGFPIMVIAVPLLLPLITNIDVNLVHLGAIFVVNIGIGVVTPPYAVSIFVGSRISNVPYEDLVKPILIYLFVVALPVLILTTFIPAFSCWLPTQILGLKVVGPW